jgi:gamma-glutamylcyclotransferase (GGCT)/AIG2-like uncharacterized protein YtfP
MRRVTVYGSLLEGLGNWYGFLKGSTKLGEHVLEDNLVMISLGGFPGLIVDEDVTNKIFVETYEVTEEIYKAIERLEGYPNFYNRRHIETPWGISEIYTLNSARGVYGYRNLVPKGEGDIINWRNYVTTTVKRYEEE